MKSYIVYLMMAVLLLVMSAAAQQTTAVSGSGSATVVPQLIKFSGVAKAPNGQPMTGLVGITFALYQEQQGGAPLWLETQSVQLDAHGNYTVQLGATQANGLPASVFTSGEARWLGVQIADQPEQPRTLLTSVAYAMKAVDAQTVGGLPPTAFVLAAPPSSSGAKAASQSAARPLATGNIPVTTAGGTVNYVPLWDSTSDITSSVITQTGSGNTAKVGINTTSPGSTLDVKGKVNASAGFNLGGKAFAFGSYANVNAFLGFAGNTTMSGAGNTANGYQALYGNTTGNNNTASGALALSSNTTGSANTASGEAALSSNTTGSNNTAGGNQALHGNTTGISNTANGMAALYYNTTGSFNTAVGEGAGSTADGSNIVGSNNSFLGVSSAMSTGSLNNATAIGGYAEVAESNALVLGCTNGVNNCPAAVNVGIGTTTPAYALDVHGTGNFTGLVSFASGQTFPGTGTITGVTAGTGLTGGGTSGNVTLAISASYQLPQTCSSNQVPQWNGSGFACWTPNAGTITGVTAGAGLTGGGTSGNVTLSVPNSGVTNAMLQNSSLTVSPGGGMTGGGKISLGGSATLGLESCSANQILEYSSGAWTCVNIPVGTITGVTAGAGLTGGGSSGNVTLSVPNSAITNPMLQNSSLTVTAGTDLTGGGAVSLGGSTTLNLDTTQVPQLAANNTFTGTQTINNNVTVAVTGAYQEGVIVQSSSGNAVSATSSSGFGVSATSSTSFGVSAGGTTGVYGGAITDSGTGVEGASTTGVGVYGQALSSAGYAVYGENAYGGYAGYFVGNVYIEGTCTGCGNFRIDHPLDPANRYLNHSSVESPDMKNIYDGNVILDEKGTAWITLPDYFEALNRDFRYQLTAIGAPGPNLYIAEKIRNNRFQIAGGKPGGEVSWQVTGIRHDAFANAHRIIPEVEKAGDQRGKYLHPVENGQPEAMGIDYARRAKMQPPERPKPPQQAAHIAPPPLQPPKLEPPKLPQPLVPPKPPQVKPPVAEQHVTAPEPQK